ncbi:MbtH family NRPS accessory protein [Streptacidiphilus sp. 4-A2]|nr:MbtH family NRPS accessory protein [Streptacidiphilus sp. 4-A2]
MPLPRKASTLVTSPFDHRANRFHVLINQEDQYSLWPQGIPVPEGWGAVAEGDFDECTAYVDAHWIDMRPRSLKEAQEAQEAQQAQQAEPAGKGSRS